MPYSRLLPFILLVAGALAPLFVLAHPGYLGTVNHLGLTTISLVIGAALIDSVNPTSLGALLLLLRARMRSAHPRRAVVRISLLYIAGHLVIYVLAGFGINRALLAAPPYVFEIIQITLAGMLLLEGIRELDQATHATPRFAFIDRIIARLTRLLRPTSQSMYPFIMGALFGLLELFLTGAIYLSFVRGITYDPTVHTGVLSTFMAIYLAVFILPLIATMLLFLVGGRRTQFSQQHPHLAAAGRLLIGIVFMGVALWLIASSGGRLI